MIRLATQFDRAAARPVVAAPKSHGCCCCCCCCIVTVVTGSILTARATSRALRGVAQAAKPSPAAADGWGNPPVEPAAPAASETTTGDSKLATPAPPASTKGWVAFAAALLPVTLCVIPSIIGGVAYFFENLVRGESLYDLPGWVGTGLSAALFLALLGAMRRFAKLGALGIALMTAPMIAVGALAFMGDAWFLPPVGLMVVTWIGGLIALARRGVPTLNVALAGISIPIAIAVEVGAWFGVLTLTVLR